MVNRKRKVIFTNRELAYLGRFQRVTGRKPGEINLGEDNLSNSPSQMNNMRHGIYASRFLSVDEKYIFETMIERFRQEYEFNSSTDLLQLELVCLYYLQIGRAIVLEEWKTANYLDLMLRRHLSDLMATRKSRGG
jgi:hypothetical protein